jgi:curli production assembly/transport component CsgG
MHLLRLLPLCLTVLLTACTAMKSTLPPSVNGPMLTPRASTYYDLVSLPEPRGKIVAAVYNFRDQTGQYKRSPASSFSTAVTQGATAMLVGAMADSNWFLTVEREGLQNLLTERKIIRAVLQKQLPEEEIESVLPSLTSANILLEGGIVAYDSNIKTGGIGMRYFGIGASEQYRVDEVTVNLRAVDVRTGQILHSVLISKTILSKEITSGIYTFIDHKKLLEGEAGMTTNEPAQLCVLAAIESALIHLISDGIQKNLWALRDPAEMDNEVLMQYSSFIRDEREIER